MIPALVGIEDYLVPTDIEQSPTLFAGLLGGHTRSDQCGLTHACETSAGGCYVRGLTCPMSTLSVGTKNKLIVVGARRDLDLLPEEPKPRLAGDDDRRVGEVSHVVSLPGQLRLLLGPS